MIVRDQSLRPRRGGLEHLALPGQPSRTSADTAPAPATAPQPPAPGAPGGTAPLSRAPVGGPLDMTAPLAVTPDGGAPGTTPVAGSPRHEDPPGRPDPAAPGRHPTPPWLTWLVVLLLAVAVLVAAGFAAGALIRGLLPDAGDRSGSSGAGASAEDASGDAASGGAVSADGIDVVTVDPAELPASWVGGGAAPGRPAGPAYRWTDANGTTTVVLSVGTGEAGAVDASGEPAAAGTLFVSSLLGEGDDVRVQRQMREPVLCDGGAVAFREGSVRVSDGDGDGVAEVTVGWTVECPASGDDVVAKLALLEGPDKFILRGPGGDGATPDPDPPSDSWPAGTYEATVARYAELFAG